LLHSVSGTEAEYWSRVHVICRLLKRPVSETLILY